MKPKSLLLGGTTVAVLGTAAAALFFLVRHEPDFYVKSAVPEGRERQVEAGGFISEFGMFVDKVQHEEPWDASFTEKAINSYFDESFVPSGVAERVLPEGVSQPRVVIEPDRLRLAFRYGTHMVTTVVSIDVRVWVAAQERNVVALELQGLHAGALPISAQSLQQQVTDMTRPQNIDVTWYRHKGNPVALLRFQADRTRPTVHLKQIELRRGFMIIRGSSSEPSTLGALLPFRSRRGDTE